MNPRKISKYEICEVFSEFRGLPHHIRAICPDEMEVLLALVAVQVANQKALIIHRNERTALNVPSPKELNSDKCPDIVTLYGRINDLIDNCKSTRNLSLLPNWSYAILKKIQNEMFERMI